MQYLLGRNRYATRMEFGLSDDEYKGVGFAIFVGTRSFHQDFVAYDFSIHQENIREMMFEFT